MKLHNSLYGCNERTDAWVKLKPEYLEGISDSLDVVIVGGYYGEGEVSTLTARTGGACAWRFLVGGDCNVVRRFPSRSAVPCPYHRV